MRIFNAFTGSNSGLLSFYRIIHLWSIFCSDENDPYANEERLRFFFHVYDVNNDGYISNADLFQILRISVGDSFNTTQAQQLTDNTIRKFDLDRDGKVGYEEFASYFRNAIRYDKPVTSLLCMDLSLTKHYK